MTATPTQTHPPELAAVEATIARYIAAWNETDADRRLELVSGVFTPDGHYVDPFVDVVGPAGIAEFIGGMQAQFPNHELTLTTTVDLHHDVARFGWQGAAPDGTVAFAGIDVVVLTGDGELAALAGFVGDLAAA